MALLSSMVALAEWFVFERVPMGWNLSIDKNSLNIDMLA
jgi:hypothetical protein